MARAAPRLKEGKRSQPSSRKPLHAVILAAGEGLRMGGGECSKCLRTVSGRSILSWVLAAVRALRPAGIHIIVGVGAEQVKEIAAGPGVFFHHQAKRLGTADAAQCALSALPPEGALLVLMGDLPLLQPANMRTVVAEARRGRYACLTMRPPVPTGYGRILRAANGDLEAIVTELDATAAQRRIGECDAGVVAMPISFARMALPKVGFGRHQKERLLTDLAALADEAGLRTLGYEVAHSEAAGVNTPAQLAAAQSMLSERRIAELIKSGVVIADEASVVVRGRLEAKAGVFIDRNVLFAGRVSIAAGVRIGANCVLEDCSIAAGAVVEPFCHLSRTRIAKNARVGPFARLRDNVWIMAGAQIGSFVEVKNSVLGRSATVKHLAYLGDAAVGAKANIGAGTVVCNYDGKRKHRTVIGDGAFVGSGSMLVAPVRIGKRALVAAGSVITDEVPDGSTAFGRARQVIKRRAKGG